MSLMRKLLLGLLLAIPLSANAAISFVAESYSQTTNSNTRTLTEPAGAADGDVIFVYCEAVITTSLTWTDPSDFTEINQNVTSTGSPSTKNYLGYKVRSGGAGQALTFSHADTNSNIACAAVAYRGANSSPLDVAFVEANHYQQGTANTPNMTAKAITTVTDNSWVLLFYGTTQSISGAAGGPSGYTADSDHLSSGLANRSIYIVHKLVASHGTETPGAFSHTDTNGTADPRAYTIALKVSAAAAPTFTSGPTAGTITPVTIPTTFTLDQTGTVYGVACPDGQTAPTVAQVKAGNCTGNVAAVSSWSEAVTASVGDAHTFTGLTPGTRYDLSFAATGTSLDTAAISSIADQDTSAVAYTSAPSCSAATDGVSCTYTTNATGTTYGVGVAPGDSAPTCTQIKAGQQNGGTAALWTGSDANTLAVSDTVSVTGTNKPVRMDLYFCQNASGADSAVDSAQTDKNRSAKSGFAIVTMASHDAAGLCNLDSYFTPDCADGDTFEYEDDTNESVDCNVSISTTGLLTLTPVNPGDCNGRRTFEISYEDVSSTTDGLFTAPTVGNFTTDDTVYVNNTAPVCSPQDDIVVLTEDVAMTSIDLSALGDCSDADADLLTYSVTSGTLPAGTSLSGTGNKDWGGTPNTENEAGAALTITVTDVAGDTTSFQFTAYVINTWAVPDLTGLTETTGTDAIIAAAPWRAADPGLTVSGTECSDESPGTIIDQTPAPAGAATADEEILVTLAVNCGEPATERKIVYVLADLTGLVRWVDYIPVSEVIGCRAGYYDEDGCWAVQALSSTTGKTAWVDYIPVGEVSPDLSGKWRYENNGWIPVDDLTP